MTNRAYKEPDFGAWLDPILEGHTIQELALEARLHHSAISRLLASSRKGKPIQPEQETVKSIADALVSLGWIDAEENAFIAAGYFPEGYRVVRQSQKQTQRLGGDDWEPDVDPDYDPYDTIVEKAGYDTNELDEDSKARLRRSIHATVIGLMEQEKREKGQS